MRTRLVIVGLTAVAVTCGCAHPTRVETSATLCQAELAAKAYRYDVGFEGLKVTGEFRRIELPGGGFEYVTQPTVTVAIPIAGHAEAATLARPILLAEVFDNGRPPSNRRTLLTRELPVVTKLGGVGVPTEVPVLRFVLPVAVAEQADTLTLVWELNGRPIRWPLDLKLYWK
jgi:hypothetical protein